MKFSRKFLNYLFPSLLGITLSVVYWMTMAPGLTWVNNGSDGGDLITAAAVNGVAHPTGYPVYLILARFFQFLPVGTLAFRTNIMSAVFAVGASVLIYAVVVSTARQSEMFISRLAGMFAGFSFGLIPLVWSQAIITEVYTLHAFFVGLILLLFAGDFWTGKPWGDRLRGGVLGLALGNHVTSVFLVPVALLLGSLEPSGVKDHISLSDIRSIRWVSLWRQFGWMLLGMLIYIILPLRAQSSPAVNWLNPVHIAGFWQLVSGQFYQSHYLQISSIGVLVHIQALASFFVSQLGILTLFVGILGVVVFFQASRLYLLTLWSFFSFLLFTFGYHTLDSFVYLIPSLISFSVWFGIGVGKLLDLGRKHFRVSTVLSSLILILFVFVKVSVSYSDVDASKDFRAEKFGEHLMSNVPVDAIVFAQGDQAVFALWYFHFALGERPDIAVLSTDLLHYFWYQEGIRAQYPLLVLPNDYLWERTIIVSNPERPVCYIEYQDSFFMKCAVN